MCASVVNFHRVAEAKLCAHRFERAGRPTEAGLYVAEDEHRGLNLGSWSELTCLEPKELACECGLSTLPS